MSTSFRWVAGETVVRILERENPAMIATFGAEADLVTILQHPATSIACDCGATTNTRQHPRAFGSFPRVLGRYVRETRVLTWEDAIRKMTALPAATVGMVDRGYVATGMAADITAFDPATVVDHATYENPALLSDGIRLVLVNGQIALRDGKLTGQRAGRVLTRTAHMPSRPMNSSAARRLSLKGSVTPQVRIDIDVTQAAGAARARGSFRLADESSNTVLEGTELGVLQTTKDWATFTARIKNRQTKAEGLVTVIVERADPSVGGHPPTVSVEIDKIMGVNGTLREPPGAIVIR
jgi:N-acyl-D-amino-acid deacylase